MTNNYYQKYVKYKNLYINKKNELHNMEGGTMPGLSNQLLNDRKQFLNLSISQIDADSEHNFISKKVEYEYLLERFSFMLSQNLNNVIDSNSLYFFIAKYYNDNNIDISDKIINMETFIDNTINNIFGNINLPHDSRNNPSIIFCFDKLTDNTLKKSNEQRIYREYSAIFDNIFIPNIYARKIIPKILHRIIHKYGKINNQHIQIINKKDGEVDNFLFEYVKKNTSIITQDGDIIISYLLRNNEKQYDNISLFLWRYSPDKKFFQIQYGQHPSVQYAQYLGNQYAQYPSDQSNLDDYDSDDQSDLDDSYDRHDFNNLSVPYESSMHGGLKPQTYDPSTAEYVPSGIVPIVTSPSYNIADLNLPLKILTLLLYTSTDAGYGKKINIQDIENIINKYHKMIKCYKYINIINITKIINKSQNVMKKFVATLTLLIFGWGVGAQIKNQFASICSYIDVLVNTITEKSKDRLLCSVYPFDNNDICNLFILFGYKDKFIELFNKELDILKEYEDQLLKLETNCKKHVILPAMVLIYCIRNENYEKCKKTYKEHIGFLDKHIIEYDKIKSGVIIDYNIKSFYTNYNIINGKSHAKEPHKSYIEIDSKLMACYSVFNSESYDTMNREKIFEQYNLIYKAYHTHLSNLYKTNKQNITLNTQRLSYLQLEGGMFPTKQQHHPHHPQSVQQQWVQPQQIGQPQQIWQPQQHQPQPPYLQYYQFPQPHQPQPHQIGQPQHQQWVQQQYQPQPQQPQPRQIRQPRQQMHQQSSKDKFNMDLFNHQLDTLQEMKESLDEIEKHVEHIRGNLVDLTNYKQTYNKIQPYIDLLYYNDKNPIVRCRFDTIETILQVKSVEIKDKIKDKLNKYFITTERNSNKQILNFDIKVLYMPLELLKEINDLLE